MMSDTQAAYIIPFDWRASIASLYARLFREEPDRSWMALPGSATARPADPITGIPKQRQVEGVADAVSTAAGDKMRGFHQTILPHLDAAYNFARFLSRDADAAQDIVQDAFLRAYRGFEHYRGGDPRAWTFAIVRNCYLAWLQQGRRRERYEIPIVNEADAQPHEPAAHRIASDEESPEMTVVRNGESQRIRQILNTLSDTAREVLVLRELEDLSYRQIAEVIEVPIGTVMSRLARARREFHDAWCATGESEAAP